MDKALAEIDRLPGRHLYFLDDHLLGNAKFAAELFEGMRGMGRVFQAAGTVDSILRGNLIEKAAEAGLRSLFVGFETFDPENLKQSNKKQNLSRDYGAAVGRLHDLGIMINGSFVFGLDEDGPDVFERTVEWGVKHAITTSTYHVLTPYPGTALFAEMEKEERIITYDWDRYDTRHVVYRTRGLTAEQLERGYWWAYEHFYSWRNIFRSSTQHTSVKHRVKHFAYTAGWKKFEPVWNFLIKTRHLNEMLPVLEAILSKVGRRDRPTEAMPIPVALGPVRATPISTE